MEVDGIVYAFGRFRLDVRDHALFRDDARVPLAPKAFDVLLALVENAGRLVTRDDLVKRLWPDTFVADNTLAQNIWLVRRALRPGAAGEADIVTVPRLGFRFAGDIRMTKPSHVGLTRASRCLLVQGKRKVPLKNGENVLGRDPDVEVQIDHATISRQHARLFVSATGVTLEDLGSKNGTLVGGRRIEGEVALADGDLIKVGSVVLKFRRVVGAMSTKTGRA